jgi:flagellar motor component MotA
MTRKKFITRYTSFVQYVIKLAKEAKRCGIESSEQEIEDIEEMEQVFKEGLRLIFAVADPAAIVNEVLSNMIVQEKRQRKNDLP